MRKEKHILRNDRLLQTMFQSSLVRRVASFMVTLFTISLFVPSLSTAYNVTGDSNTYLLSGETTDKHKMYDLFEYLNFSVQDDKEKISFHVSGWADYDLGWKNPNRQPQQRSE